MNQYRYSLLLLFMISYCTLSQTRYKLPCDSTKNDTEGRICVLEEFEKADKDLDNAYQRLLSKIRAYKTSLQGEDRTREENIEKLIISSQKEWLEYRNSAYNIREKLFAGGSELSQVVSIEGTQLTRERILEIEDLLVYYHAW